MDSTVQHDETIDLATLEGFGRVWMSYEPELRRFAMRVLWDPSSADDAMRDAFLRASRRRGSFDATRSTLRSWLFATLRNTIIDGAPDARTAACWRLFAALQALPYALDELGREQ